MEGRKKQRWNPMEAQRQRTPHHTHTPHLCCLARVDGTGEQPVRPITALHRKDQTQKCIHSPALLCPVKKDSLLDDMDGDGGANMI